MPQRRRGTAPLAVDWLLALVVDPVGAKISRILSKVERAGQPFPRHFNPSNL
ncbi:MAG TPA: hypothetical protein VIW23_14060 [Candidatus Acidoferrum sp.]|jgi:hypothetical protein